MHWIELLVCMIVTRVADYNKTRHWLLLSLPPPDLLNVPTYYGISEDIQEIVIEIVISEHIPGC